MVLFVDRAVVVGAGVMGARIAEVLALNGVTVTLRDIDEGALARARQIVERDLKGLVAFHAGKANRAIADFEGRAGVKLTEEQRRTANQTMRPTFDAARTAAATSRMSFSQGPVPDADIIIEAVPESLQLKRSVLAALPDTLTVSNTSTIPIAQLAAELGDRKGRFLGLHFFNPPTTMPLVEVIPSVGTRQDIVEDVINWVATLRNHRYPMIPIRVMDCPGFLVNRILGAMLQEAFACHEQKVAHARDIDAAMKAGAGLPMGPLELADMVGLDIILHAADAMADQGGRNLPEAAFKHLRELVAAGHLGQKSGRGFYEYRQGGA